MRFDEITLAELIHELQEVERMYPGSVVRSIGTCGGCAYDMDAPYSIMVKKMVDGDLEYKRAFVPAYKHDVGKTIIVDD